MSEIKPGPICRDGSFMWQLDEATGVNLWSGKLSANNGYPEEYALKAAALFEAATASHAAEVETDRRDAERYRWLRKSRDVTLITMFFGNGCVNKTIEMAEEKIDAALKGDKP